MGGRGASSGVSASGKKYGTEYHTVLELGNIKFVKKNEGSTTSPMETMTQRRIYVTVNKQDELKSITYYDKNGRRIKQIDLTHDHIINNKLVKPHIHLGYEHDEKGTRKLNKAEKKILDLVVKAWQNKNSK